MKGMTRLAMLAMAFMLAVSVGAAQQTKSYEPNNYYYNQARQSMDNADYATAYDYLGKEIAQYPTNGHAYFWLGY